MTEPSPPGAGDPLGDREAFELLCDLVAIHPSNLEDPVRGRFEKPRYGVALQRIERSARSWGLTVRRYDPVQDGPNDPSLHGIPRPNLIIDLDRGAPERVLVLAHYDVVPVPEEQLGRWKSPPRELTERSDGRWYGRGANDDLGCGVVGTLLAMKRLARGPSGPRDVRLLVCCDEETGGEGGIESLKHHDAALRPEDPERFVSGEVALIPDGSPHATPASSGVAFLDASFSPPVPLSGVLEYGAHLEALHGAVSELRSQYLSPDYPSHGAPAPVLTGRATVTRFDFGPVEGPGSTTRLVAAHAETDAANFIPESVTLAFAGAEKDRARLRARLNALVPAGFSVGQAAHTALIAPPGSELLQVTGLGGHGGSPHRARNPVPVALSLLRTVIAEGLVDPTTVGPATYAVDLRMIPEASFATGMQPFLDRVDAWSTRHLPSAHLEAPVHRRRTGYALSPTDPHLLEIAKILESTLHAHGVFGEYGGTDASSLADVRTRAGRPLSAIVFGSMDRASRIHDAEESADPALLAGVSETIRRFVAGP